MVNVGGIDCRVEEELCEEFGVFDIPQIVIFSENYSDEGERFRGKMEANAIQSAAGKKMQNFVRMVNSDNYESFVDSDRLTKQKVLLFSDKKATPAIYKALSKTYMGKLVMGQVRHTDTALLDLFGGNVSFPTLMVLTDPDNKAGEFYDGEMKVD